MNERSQVTKTSNFYKDYRETNPTLVLGIILISFGFYIIHYMKNKEFEEIDSNSPEAARGAIILMVLPFIWFFIIFIIKKIITENLNILIKICETIGWSIIIFLILNYIYDFCMTFGRITKEII